MISSVTADIRFKKNVWKWFLYILHDSLVIKTSKRQINWVLLGWWMSTSCWGLTPSLRHEWICLLSYPADSVPSVSLKAAIYLKCTAFTSHWKTWALTPAPLTLIRECVLCLCIVWAITFMFLINQTDSDYRKGNMAQSLWIFVLLIRI